MDDRVREFLHSHQSLSPYKYDLLGQDSFRLVQILPGVDTDRLELRLETHNLYLWHPQYEALSYTWGEQTDLRYVSCNGLDLAITDSLDIALRRFRSSDIPRRLWVDQCCIDQSNIKERSQQVNRLRDIYSSATRVLAWLGKDPDGVTAKKAARAILTLSAIIRSDSDVATLYIPSEAQYGPKGAGPDEYSMSNPAAVDAVLASYSLPVSTDEEWQSFLEICKVEYFERLWIIQENRLAGKVLMIWDDTEIDWKDLEVILSFLLQHDLLRQNQHRVQLFMPTMKYMFPFVVSSAIYSLREFFWWTRLHKCKDPRDRTFAILALWSDLRRGPDKPKLTAAEDSDLLIADYSLTLNQTLFKAARAICRDSLTLDFLSFIHHQQLPNSTGLASWVPHWGPTSNSFLFEMNRGSGASGNFRSTVTLDGEEPWLLSSAIVFDEIGYLSEPLSYPSETEAARFVGVSPGSKRVQRFWNLLLRYRMLTPKPALLDGETTGVDLLDLLALIRCLKRDWGFEKELAAVRNTTRYTNLWVSELLSFAKWHLSILMEDFGLEDAELQESLLRFLYFPGAGVLAADYARELMIGLGTSPLAQKEFEPSAADIERCHVIASKQSDDLVTRAGQFAYLLRAWSFVNSFEGVPAFSSSAGRGGMEGKLFISKEGRLGVGPKIMNPGDKVAVLLGGPVPYILRPTGEEGEEGFYYFVGECYLPGLMEGAVVEDWSKPGTKMLGRDIILR